MMTPATAHLWQIPARLAHADQQKNRPNQSQIRSVAIICPCPAQVVCCQLTGSVYAMSMHVISPGPVGARYLDIIHMVLKSSESVLLDTGFWILLDTVYACLTHAYSF